MILRCFTIVATLSVFMLVTKSLAQESPDSGNTTPNQATVSSVAVEKLADKVDSLNEDMRALNNALETKKKDVWDKITAVSGLVSGVLIALIGGIATFVYRERQRAAEDARSQRDNAVAQVQTVQSFLPHLQSADSREREAALLAIGALGNPELATRLADLYRDEAGIGALSKMAASADTVTAHAAKKTLDNVFDRLRPTVVEIRSKDEKEQTVASGFLVSPHGHILTADYVVRHADSGSINICFTDGEVRPAEILKIDSNRGLAVLKVVGNDFPHLTIAENVHKLILMTEVIALGFEPRIGWLTASGRILGKTIAAPGLSVPSGSIQAQLQVPPGFGGAPVVDTDGRLVGVVHSSMHDSDTNFLVPADACVAVLQDVIPSETQPVGASTT